MCVCVYAPMQALVHFVSQNLKPVAVVRNNSTFSHGFLWKISTSDSLSLKNKTNKKTHFIYLFLSLSKVMKIKVIKIHTYSMYMYKYKYIDTAKYIS